MSDASDRNSLEAKVGDRALAIAEQLNIECDPQKGVEHILSILDRGIGALAHQKFEIVRINSTLEDKVMDSETSTARASDTYWQIGEELEVPMGGSVVETVMDLKDIKERLVNLGVVHGQIEDKDDPDAADQMIETFSKLLRNANERS